MTGNHLLTSVCGKVHVHGDTLYEGLIDASTPEEFEQMHQRKKVSSTCMVIRKYEVLVMLTCVGILLSNMLLCKTGTIYFIVT